VLSRQTQVLSWPNLLNPKRRKLSCSWERQAAARTMVTGIDRGTVRTTTHSPICPLPPRAIPILIQRRKPPRAPLTARRVSGLPSRNLARCPNVTSRAGREPVRSWLCLQGGGHPTGGASGFLVASSRATSTTGSGIHTFTKTLSIRGSRRFPLSGAGPTRTPARFFPITSESDVQPRRLASTVIRTAGRPMVPLRRLSIPSTVSIGGNRGYVTPCASGEPDAVADGAPLIANGPPFRAPIPPSVFLNLTPVLDVARASASRVVSGTELNHDRPTEICPHPRLTFHYYDQSQRPPGADGNSLCGPSYTSDTTRLALRENALVQ